MVQKLAVLGGGPASLAAVLELTKDADWRERWDITVYQMGWRLGGKGASSREPGKRGRNLEHGLHVLGGFYGNALEVLGPCYDDWRVVSPDCAIPFDQAFLPSNEISLMEEKNGKWRRVAVPLEKRSDEISDGPVELTIWTMIKRILTWARSRIVDGPSGWYSGSPRQLGSLSSDATFMSWLNQSIKLMPDERPADPVAFTGRDQILANLSAMNAYLESGRWTASPTGTEPDYWMLFRIAFGLAYALIFDGIAFSGFDKLNDLELRQWLAKRGMKQDVLSSIYVSAGYDYMFAYRDGDPGQPSMAAGVGVRGFLRMLFTYRDSVFVHMNGGMGEIVFTPIYEVLKNRGVKFAFFHRVDRLEYDHGSRSISAIELTVQSDCLNGALGYDPLIVVNGRCSWPVAPLDGQLSSFDPSADYESQDATPQGATPKKLTAGSDFDQIILGIPVGALHTICAGLRDGGAHGWARMLDASHAIGTLSVQLWLNKDVAALGAIAPNQVMTTFAQPLATFADMSFLLPHETGPQPPNLTLAYYTGTLPPRTSANDPVQSEDQRGKAICEHWLNNHNATLFPAWPGPQYGLRQGTVTDSFFLTNHKPSERYVLSLPGSIDDRMRCDDTGVTNLCICGDWIRSGVDSGSFENAVLSGRQCARAVMGRDYPLPGERDRLV